MLKELQDRNSAYQRWLVAIALWSAVTAISAIALWHMHNNAVEGQLRETSLISRALADEMDRALRGVEKGLFALRSELRDDGILRLSGDAGTDRLLNRCASLMPLARMLWLTDGDGRLLSSSGTTALPDPESFFPPLTQLSAKATAVSRPFTDKATRESLVAMAIRVSGSTNDTSGWIVAGVPASALFGTFSVVSPGSDARMAVFRNDGVRLVGMIDETVTVDEETVARILASQPSIGVHKFHDGSERLVSLHDLPQYGLKLLLTRDLRVALKPWRNTALGALTGIVLLLAILVIAVRRIVCADRRYAESQRALQAQRARASKFESLGTLASGIAHDVNNVLAAILGFGEMAQDAAAPGSHQARHLDKVLQAALRGRALIERILTFSRTGAHGLIVFELEPIVEEVLSLLESSLRAGVTLEHRLAVPAARLRGDPTQAFEAVMNLCTNAMQAMPNGGVLRVQLERVYALESRVLSHGQLKQGSYLSLSVTDQGVGISPEVMERLFEPFFTTNGERSGTGLGLAVVHGVVGEFGGAIDVHSTPGKGSRFTLYFPECTEALVAPKPLPTVEATGCGQRLMIIDDEPALVLLAEETLRGLGYEPVGFSDPTAALAALRENPGQFAAVITDEVMPKLCGTRFTQALRASAPDLPVLLISGCGGALLASRAVAVGVTRVLSKPLQRAELERALAEVLRPDVAEPDTYTSVPDAAA